MTLKVNWHQTIAADGAVRVHQNLGTNQPKECGFEQMVGDWIDYNTENEVRAAMLAKPWKRYRHCSHCWDGQYVDLE